MKQPCFAQPLKARRRGAARTMALVTLLVCLPLGPGADAETEFVGHAIEVFGEEPLCCDGYDALNFAIDKVWDVADIFTSWDFDSSERENDGDCNAKHFVDSEIHYWGRDHIDWWGIDSADVAMWVTHGYYKCSGGQYYSGICPGSSYQSDCQVRADYYYGDFEVGSGGAGGDLNVLIGDSCNSGQQCVWWHGGYFFDGNGNFAVYNAFHGYARDDSVAHDDMVDYVNHARWNYVGDNWLDYIYRYRSEGYNVCPVSSVLGSSQDNVEYIYLYGGLQDWKDPGSRLHARYFYLDGCDPNGGPEL